VGDGDAPLDAGGHLLLTPHDGGKYFVPAVQSVLGHEEVDEFLEDFNLVFRFEAALDPAGDKKLLEQEGHPIGLPDLTAPSLRPRQARWRPEPWSKIRQEVPHSYCRKLRSSFPPEQKLRQERK